MPVAHVARAMGVSRQCAHRWVARFDSEGITGLEDRSSRPHSMPTKTPLEVEAQVLAARHEHRRGQDWLGPELGVPARTVSRILRRHKVPHLAVCDPMTGEMIRASKTTAVRYERSRPGELLHMDVKKIGRIPAGGGWRARGREVAGDNAAHKKARTGFDYIHSVVDDYSRVAYSEILDDEKAATCAAFFARAVDVLAGAGIDRVEAVMTDNHWSYTHSNQLAALLEGVGAKHILIRPHCPWQNGKVERFNRTLQTEWAYRQVFTSNAERTAALTPWLEYYNTRRRHSALGGLPPISRLSPT
jgi:transposase InsO family protein